jgi:hypothetical protein
MDKTISDLLDQDLLELCIEIEAWGREGFVPDTAKIRTMADILAQSSGQPMPTALLSAVMLVQQRAVKRIVEIGK